MYSTRPGCSARLPVLRRSVCGRVHARPRVRPGSPRPGPTRPYATTVTAVHASQSSGTPGTVPQCTRLRARPAEHPSLGMARSLLSGAARAGRFWPGPGGLQGLSMTRSRLGRAGARRPAPAGRPAGAMRVPCSYVPRDLVGSE
jgi:hypothetical protein